METQSVVINDLVEISSRTSEEKEHFVALPPGCIPGGALPARDDFGMPMYDHTDS
jgi:hypothetical protein